MESRENPQNFFLKVDRIAWKLERLGKPVDQNDRNVAAESRLSPEYGVKQRILEGGNEKLTRAPIERVVTNYNTTDFKRRNRKPPQRRWQ